MHSLNASSISCNDLCTPPAVLFHNRFYLALFQNGGFAMLFDFANECGTRKVTRGMQSASGEKQQQRERLSGVTTRRLTRWTTGC